MITTLRSYRCSQRFSLDALLCVGYAQLILARPDMNIEPVFAYVDAGARLHIGLLFGRFLALHAGRAPYHLLRTKAEGRKDQAHPRCFSPRGFDGPIRPRGGWWPPAPARLSQCNHSHSSERAPQPCKGVTLAERAVSLGALSAGVSPSPCSLSSLRSLRETALTHQGGGGRVSGVFALSSTFSRCRPASAHARSPAHR